MFLIVYLWVKQYGITWGYMIGFINPMIGFMNICMDPSDVHPHVGVHVGSMQTP